VPIDMKSPVYRLSTEGTVAQERSGAMHGHRVFQGMKRLRNEADEAIAVGRRRYAVRESRAHFVSRAAPQRHARDTAGPTMQRGSPQFMSRSEPCHGKVMVALIDEVWTR